MSKFLHFLPKGSFVHLSLFKMMRLYHGALVKQLCYGYLTFHELFPYMVVILTVGSIYNIVNIRALLYEIINNFICRVGGKQGAMHRCKTCNGRGVKVTLRQLGPGMVQQMQSLCPDCRGEGKWFKTLYYSYCSKSVFTILIT